MRPIRINETNHNFLLDRRLSYKARGVLAYIFEHKGQWDVHMETLINSSDEDGRIAVQSAMQELIKWQYAELVLVRDKSGKVKGREYSVYDVPLDMQPNRRAENLPVGCPHCGQEQESHVDPCSTRQAGNLPVGTDKQKNRQSENLSVGTDKQETRQSGNLSVGKSGKIGVDTEAHRQAGFPMIVKPDNQETCSTTNSLKNKTKDLTPPPISPSPEPLGGVGVERQTVGQLQDATADSFNQQRKIDAQTVLAYLNQVTEMRYKKVTFIEAILRDGASIEECKCVIDWWDKVWTVNHPHQRDFFDSATPFKRENFTTYLPKAQKWQEQGQPAKHDPKTGPNGLVM